MDLEFKQHAPRIILSRFLIYLLALFMISFLIFAIIYINFYIFNDELNSKIDKDILLISNIVRYFITTAIIITIIAIIYKTLDLIISPFTTKYRITDNYISRKTTQLDKIIEDVPIKEITNVSYSISWFLDKIFKTGTILIYTSGSMMADISFRGIKFVTKIYNELNEKINLYRKDIIIKKESKLIKTIKPNVAIATTFTFFRTFPFIIILIIFLFGDTFKIQGLLLLIAISIPILITFLIYTYKKRYYHFYTDKLEYYDGFFTYNKVTVPIERITNIDFYQSLMDRVFDVSTIRIETAGSFASEINIKFVNNGEKIVSDLKEVLKENGRN